MAHPFDRLLTIDTLRVDDALRAFDALVRAHTLMQPPGSYLRRIDGVLLNSEGREHDSETDPSKSTLVGWIIRGIGKGWTSYHPAFVIAAHAADLAVRVGGNPTGVIFRQETGWSHAEALAVLRRAIVKAGSLADVAPFDALEERRAEVDAPRKSDLVDREVDLLHTADRAALVRDHETGREVWLPLSQCEIAPSEDGQHHIATLPEWLAIEEELV